MKRTFLHKSFTDSLFAAPLQDNMANPKEKTPMCLVNELARFNRIQPQYKLLNERGPAHAKVRSHFQVIWAKCWMLNKLCLDLDKCDCKTQPYSYYKGFLTLIYFALLFSISESLSVFPLELWLLPLSLLLISVKTSWGSFQSITTFSISFWSVCFLDVWILLPSWCAYDN